MIKEYLLAIILGAILGLGVTGAFFATHKKNNPSNQSATSLNPSASESVSSAPTPTATPKPDGPINITSPEDGSVVSSSKINIKGDAKPNSVIVISTPSQSFSDKANANGIFNIPIELDSGFNLIKINSIDPNDKQDQIEINLTYSSAKI